MYVNNVQLTKTVIRDGGQTYTVRVCTQRVTVIFNIQTKIWSWVRGGAQHQAGLTRCLS
jgi:hypothetical protein